jgi:hypothetical protein
MSGEREDEGGQAAESERAADQPERVMRSPTAGPLLLSARHPQLLITDPHQVAHRQLAPAPLLGLSVHRDRSIREQLLGLSSPVRDPSELEQLPEANHRAPDHNLTRFHD